MARALPYRAKCPPNIAALIEEAPYSRLFVLSDPGPTSFVLRGEASPRRFKVTIGETHSCTCHSGNELCAHVLFVLTRVFRMPAANPLVWQLSLTEREIRYFEGQDYSTRKQKGAIDLTRLQVCVHRASESSGALSRVC